MGYFLLKNTRISHTHNKGPHCEKISDLLTVQGTVLVEKSFILKVHFITSSDNARVGPVWVVPRGTNIYTVVKVLHTHTWVETPSLSETSGFGCPKKERKSCCSPTCAFFRTYMHKYTWAYSTHDLDQSEKKWGFTFYSESWLNLLCWWFPQVTVLKDFVFDSFFRIFTECETYWISWPCHQIKSRPWNSIVTIGSKVAKYWLKWPPWGQIQVAIN